VRRLGFLLVLSLVGAGSGCSGPSPREIALRDMRVYKITVHRTGEASEPDAESYLSWCCVYPDPTTFPGSDQTIEFRATPGATWMFPSRITGERWTADYGVGQGRRVSGSGTLTADHVEGNWQIQQRVDGEERVTDRGAFSGDRVEGRECRMLPPPEP